MATHVWLDPTVATRPQQPTTITSNGWIDIEEQRRIVITSRF